MTRKGKIEQEALEAVNRFRAEAGELHNATHGQLTDQMARGERAGYKPVPPRSYGLTPPSLCITKQVVSSRN